MNNKTADDNAQARFGTLGGVFTPCVLTILGVIMFMRAGFVTGYGGMWLALAILGLSKLITTLTTLSLSAIATNLEMRVGGVYFMISRVLGPDFGGSIGITLYFANAVGVAFYAIGFTEALMALLPIDSPLLSAVISSVVVGVLFFVTFKGADIAIKAQYGVLVILLLAVVAFLIGGIMNFDAATLKTNSGSGFTDKMTFWMVFAVFFPAATGITAGANMSGDLKKPAKSIPWGTLLAIGFTAIIYTAQIILLAGSTPREDLMGRGYEALQEMSVFGPLIIMGVFAATLSSALGSFLGAPRILQAMGQDRLMKVMNFFGKGSGAANEPRRATVLTFIIALAVIWIPVLMPKDEGGANPLNSVAEIISMFFLIAYGMINLSAFVESKSANPSFRPSFKYFHWVTGLIGALGCGIAMIKINETYAIVAVSIAGIIYFYLRKRDIKTSYGDAKRGFIFQKTRDNLLYLEQAKVHPKNWRPILVAITEDPIRQAQLVRVGSWIESRRGLYTIANIAERPGASVADKIKLRNAGRAELARQLAVDDIVAFPEFVAVDNYYEGLATFMQSYSMGGLRPNTVLVSMPPSSDTVAKERFGNTMETLASFDLNLAILKPGDIAIQKRRRTIDLWWRGEKNGSLMSLFAYLMTLDKTWAGSQLRVMRIVNNDQEEKEARIHLNELKEHTRIDARIEVIRSDESPQDIIASRSGPVADLVLLGMAAASGDEVRRFLDLIDPLLERLPATVLVWSNGEADVFA